jgi:DNA-binding SARP family transcriptional activator
LYVLQTLGAVALYPGPTADLTGEPLLRGSKTLVLAAYLAERLDHSATREHLAELFWPAVPSSQARRSLRQALYYLAHAGGEGILESDGELVRLAPDCCALDAQMFEQALREDRFEEAIELYSGPFLQGFDPGKSRELETWMESVRERLEVGHRQALRESARTALVRGDPDQAVVYARRAAAAFPLDDPIHALLLESLNAAGHPGEAVREYEAYRVLLHEELEDVPSGDITEIAERARELALQRTAEAVQAPVGEAPLEQGPPTGAPTDRRRPEPKPSTGRIGLLLRAIVLVGVTAAIIFFGLRWLGLSSGLTRGTADAGAAAAPATDPPVRIRANQRLPDGMRPVTLEIAAEHPTTAKVVEGSEGEVGLFALKSPDGRFEAVRVQTQSGPDIEILDARTGERVATVPNRDGRTPDDHLHAWSPDSRMLLFSSGLFDADGEYDHRVFLFDVESQTLRPLSDRLIAPSRNPAWSPRGDRIVFESYRPGAGIDDIRTDILLTSIDGRTTEWLTDDDARESVMSWSPDGTRIAYQKGSPAAADIYVLDLESRVERPLDTSPWHERAPIWISNREIVYVRLANERREIMVVPADGSSEPRTLAQTAGVAELWQRFGPVGSVPWIESVTAAISAPDGVLSPGEHAELEVEIRDASGAVLHPAEIRFEWRLLDPRRASILEDGFLAVTDTGTIRLVADIGGWRADTLVLESRELATSDGATLLFEERWEGGIADANWQPFGTPEPTARPSGGPESGGVFRNEGDENNGSGAFTTRRFPTAGGLSVEAWGRVPLTGGHFQTWELELVQRAERDPDTAELSPGGGTVKIQLISGGANAGATSYLITETRNQPLPEPARIGEWRLHTLQLHPDGMVEWVMDGRRYASIHSHRPVPDSVHVAIGGRTVGTDIEHGTVRVWQGPRYVPARD